MHPVLFHIGAIYIPSYGASVAVGVLLALFLAQRTARIADLDAAQVWNLCVLSLFGALVAERLFLIAANLGDLRRHPWWLLSLSMVHHPLLLALGALAGTGVAALYASRHGISLRSTADVLAAPIALGLAFEQLGALMAGSGYGTETSVRWAVTYNSVLAGIWSGTPLGIPLHPVQAYAALSFLTLSVFLFVWMPATRRPGDVAGIGLMGMGVIVFITEIWRDTEGRGLILNGALDAPQLAAVGIVLAGALLLMEWKNPSSSGEATHG